MRFALLKLMSVMQQAEPCCTPPQPMANSR